MGRIKKSNKNPSNLSKNKAQYNVYKANHTSNRNNPHNPNPNNNNNNNNPTCSNNKTSTLNLKKNPKTGSPPNNHKSPLNPKSAK